MSDTVLLVEKDTDLMRSTFIAYGLAEWLHQLAAVGSGTYVKIRDIGSAYQISSSMPRETIIARVCEQGMPQLLPAILKPLSAKELKRKEAGTPLSEIQLKYKPIGFTGNTVDYGAEKQKEDDKRKTKKNKTHEEGDIPQRHPDFPLWAHLCSYFGKGSAMRTGYPLVLHTWYAHQGSEAEMLCDLILDCYGDFPADTVTAYDYWVESIKPRLSYDDFGLFNWDKNQADVSALSVVSPTTAQGSYTNSGARNINTGTPDIFWLEMYFALVGFMQVGMPYRADKDVILYYPLPHQIQFVRVRQIMAEYRQGDYAQTLYSQSNYLPRAKIDALFSILFYQNMVAHYLRNVPGKRRLNAISGLVGYYYKDISTQIPFDETTFALPAWLPDEVNAEVLENAEGVLEQHHALIRSIRGDFAEELVIINHYRRFITLGHPDDWINFAITYSQHRFNKLPDQPWLSFLTISILEKTLMNNKHKDYRPIFENAGFQHITEAINSCTVNLRYWKDVKKQKTAFKVRHGLGDDLRRRAHNADHFIEDLSNFVHDYIRESSSVQANTSETRAFITVDDLYDVITLVNQYGSRVIASLLVAAGYASRFERKTEQD